MNHGRTVQESLQALGLQECFMIFLSPLQRYLISLYSRRDVLPGVEVRLLDHQLIGVSWYDLCDEKCMFIS